MAERAIGVRTGALGLAAAGVLLVVVAEVLSIAPLKVPGHRSLPGGLVLAAMVLGVPGRLAAVLAVVSGALVAWLARAKGGAAIVFSSWVVPVAVLLARFDRRLLAVLVGAAHGVLLGLSGPGAGPMRVAAHVGFGVFGAGLSVGLLGRERT